MATPLTLHYSLILTADRKNEKFYIVDKRLDIYHSIAYNNLMNKNYLKTII